MLCYGKWSAAINVKFTRIVVYWVNCVEPSIPFLTTLVKRDESIQWVGHFNLLCIMLIWVFTLILPRATLIVTINRGGVCPAQQAKTFVTMSISFCHPPCSFPHCKLPNKAGKPLKPQPITCINFIPAIMML